MPFVKGQERLPGSGRKKGTPNRETVEKRIALANAEAIQSTEMPKDYMLRVMRNPLVDEGRRDMMARACAQYCHPQLQAVAHKHVDAQGNPIAPVVVVQVMQAPPEPETPRLSIEGPKDGESVQ